MSETPVLAGRPAKGPSKSPPSHLRRLMDLTPAQVSNVITRSLEIKAHPDTYEDELHRKGMLMLFEKTSTRTLLSYQSAINQLGGYGVMMDWQASNFSISPIRHEVAYASRNCDVVMARLRSHADIVELAEHSLVPVINGCCEKFHPSQALADLMTIHEIHGGLDTTLAYVGVHNNIANSLIEAALLTGLRLVLVTPITNQASWDADLMAKANASGLIEHAPTVEDAARVADFIYTDTWIDMEHFHDDSRSEENSRRMTTMLPFQLNRQNLGSNTPWIMHDMPIHPGFEIDEELVFDPKSIIYQQAENRLHAQKALLLELLLT